MKRAIRRRRRRLVQVRLSRCELESWQRCLQSTPENGSRVWDLCRCLAEDLEKRAKADIGHHRYNL